MSNNQPQQQGGVILIEVLIAILIFSFGILGLVGIQANAIKQSGDAKLRTDASYLVGQIISHMWIDRSNLASYVHFPAGNNCTFTGSASTAANVSGWLGSTGQSGTVSALPNATAQIIVETGTNLVTVTVCWRAPQETATHNFTSTALISL